MGPRHLVDDRRGAIPLARGYPEEVNAVERVRAFLRARIATGDADVGVDDVMFVFGSGVTRPPEPLQCLRHTFGTVIAGRVPLPVLQRLMGHADVKTTLRYVGHQRSRQTDRD